MHWSIVTPIDPNFSITSGSWSSRVAKASSFAVTNPVMEAWFDTKRSSVFTSEVKLTGWKSFDKNDRDDESGVSATIFSQSILFSFKEDCISGETKMDASKTSRHPALGFPCFSAIVLAFFNANLASALKRTLYPLQCILWMNSWFCTVTYKTKWGCDWKR